MKCPKCGKQLRGIPPLSNEEWICDNTVLLQVGYA